MYLKSLEIAGFKSFGKKSSLAFTTPITGVVGPNGSGKSNVAESFRFVLGEQSIKSLRGKKGEDLIWNGSNAVPRAGRASVSLTFDNTQRLLNLDFDEVKIERVVNRDGTNEYLLNGSQVRLKDVVELLAGANIGSSGHHIISQGEADRVLSANPKERRAMIEDALGLRIYQYKKDESIKKLEKTQENKTQVEALRRENTPHLKFLERQMHKIERARTLREELVHVYRDYLKREELYIRFEHERLAGEREEPQRELERVSGDLEYARRQLADSQTRDKNSDDLLRLEQELASARRNASETSRELGRLEGQIAFEERRLEEEARKVHEEEGRAIPYREVRSMASKVEQKAHEGQGSDSLDHVKSLLRDTHEVVQGVVVRYASQSHVAEIPNNTDTLERLQQEKETYGAKLQELETRSGEIEAGMHTLKETIEQERSANRSLEQNMFALLGREHEIRQTLGKLAGRESMLRKAQEELKRETAEAVALIGRAVQGYADEDLQGEHGGVISIEEMEREDRTVQEERRRNLEKMKIRLEELGGAGAEEIEKEYTEVKERDAFLEREILDLEKSSETLHTLIDDLERELDEKFQHGLDAISQQFNTFFTIMFGGGSATLDVVTTGKRKKISDLLGFGSVDETQEDDSGSAEEESGVEIHVSLPGKRVKGLMMLSGGERALTSIALIFAMSQISAPPFIILDETDAALDEANSRRYGDMIETLSKKSQLILITHNRETMSRAGVLYGVTMSSDGISKLLSVKFEEAASVAK